jgi:hypothetical protein
MLVPRMNVAVATAADCQRIGVHRGPAGSKSIEPGSQIANPRPRPGPGLTPPPTHFPIVRGSGIDGHRWSAGDAGQTMRINKLEVVARGRNRTNDTRIFSTTESAVRCGKAEEAEQVFDRPTEPPAPTEPITNPGHGV